MLGKLFASLSRIANGMGSTSKSLYGVGRTAFGHAAGFAKNAVKYSEGGLVTGANFVLPGNKARTGEEALKKIFPFYGKTANKHLGFNDVSKLLKDDFVEASGFTKGHLSHTTANITNADLIANARNARAAKRLGRIKISSVGAKNILTETVADERAFAMNPKIVRNVGVTGLAVSGTYGLVKGIPYQAPDPSVYYDGVNMRHENDMGANANYARAVMGRNSKL